MRVFHRLRLCCLFLPLVVASACQTSGADRSWVIQPGDAGGVATLSDAGGRTRIVSTELPGWFDVGAGSGVAMNIHDGDNNDAAGILVSLRAYPFGRWYTFGKTGGSKDVHTYAIEGGWHRRFSALYGISAGNFTGGGLESEIHVLGIAFDVTPEFAILAGGCMFEYEEDGESDTDFAPYFGVSLNLNAFRKLFGGLVGVDLPENGAGG